MSSRRFEEAATKSHMSKAQVRQHRRILVGPADLVIDSQQAPDTIPLPELTHRDEEIEAQEQSIKNDMKATQRAGWNDSLEESSERKSLKNKEAAIKEEVSLANKALVKVRRAQLQQLLEDEWEMYEAELHSMGLAFPRDRL